MLPQSIDIKENYLLTEYPEALDLLLIDQTTHKNIFWASKSYEQLGDGYKFFDSITREKITGENGNVIKPRAAKSKEEQTMRVKVNAEVFTPSWICNKQNNLVDQSWFGRKDVFNKEDGTTWHPTEGKIRFPNKTGKFQSTRIGNTTLITVRSYISLSRYRLFGVGYCLFVLGLTRASCQINERLHTFFFV